MLESIQALVKIQIVGQKVAGQKVTTHFFLIIFFERKRLFLQKQFCIFLELLYINQLCKQNLSMMVKKNVKVVWLHDAKIYVLCMIKIY